jgi:NitT/TauT family transport system permease protein
MFQDLKYIFSPNKTVSKPVILIVIAIQIVLLLAVWYSTGELIPKPHEVFNALGSFFKEGDLLRELATSTGLCLEAMGIAIVLSLIVAYLTVLPFFRPPAFLISKGRFLTLVGLSFVFTLMVSGGHSLKVWLMVFGISVFMVTSLISMIKSIPRIEFDHARTLRMSEWQTVWEVVILGKIDQVFEIIRQNFAIAWMMLTMVEGISRSEGGIGTMLLNQSKHLHLDAVFAIQIVILLVGIFMDYLIGVFKNILCPYARLTLERD